MPETQRHPVDYRYDCLNWDFLKELAIIAYYGGQKYKDPCNYIASELTGDKSPINHMIEHYRQFMTREPHDQFPERGPAFHLAVIAYNCMMQYHYETHLLPGRHDRPYVAPPEGAVPDDPKFPWCVECGWAYGSGHANVCKYSSAERCAGCGFSLAAGHAPNCLVPSA